MQAIGGAEERGRSRRLDRGLARGRLADAGLETPIFTDVTRDGTLKGLNRELMRQVRQLWLNTLIVGGGVANVGDVRLLQEEGIQGAIVGRAIYEGTLSYPVVLH